MLLLFQQADKYRSAWNRNSEHVCLFRALLLDGTIVGWLKWMAEIFTLRIKDTAESHTLKHGPSSGVTTDPSGTPVPWRVL